MIRIRPIPRAAWTERSSARIWAWVVTSSAVDGSSAIRSSRVARQGRRQGDALTHAARELEGVAPRHVGVVDPHLREPANRVEPQRRSLAAPRRPVEPLGDVVAAAQQRVQHRERILVEQRDARASQRLHPALAHGVQVVAAVGDASGRHDVPRQQADEGLGQHRLAAPGLADDADRLALRDRQVDPRDDRSPRRRPARAVLDPDVLQLDERCAVRHQRLLTALARRS